MKRPRRVTTKKIVDVIEYLIIILVLISSSTIWVQEDYGLLNITHVRTLSLLLAVFWTLYLKRDLIIRMQKNDLYILYCMVIFMCLYGITHTHWILSPIVIAFTPMLVFSLMMIVAREESRLDEIVRKFVIVMTVLAVESLIFYVLVNYGLIKPTGYVSNLGWSWIARIPTYYNIYYDPMPGYLFGYRFSRNCAIFPESPMYCYPLCIALMFNELLANNRSVIKSIILVATIVTTISTTGFLFIGFLYAYKIWSDQKAGISVSKFMVFVVVFVAAITVSIVLLGWKMTAGASYSIRFDHVIASFKCFADTHGMGCGIGNYEYVEKFMQRKQGAACGLPYMFAQGGLFWGGLYFVPFFIKLPVIIRKNYNNVISSFGLFTFLLFLTACHNKYNTWFCYPIILFNNHRNNRITKLKAMDQ